MTSLADEVRMTLEEKISTTSVMMTDAAVSRVRRLLEERELPGHALRVYVAGGGCSGLQYGMALEGTPRHDDHRMSFGDVDVVIDPVSLGYLDGATIDFVDAVTGSGFKIDNPNAPTGCGCGQSTGGADQGSPDMQGGCACR
jgi:iron-sulfur cluster assembly accessory protein